MYLKSRNQASIPVPQKNLQAAFTDFLGNPVYGGATKRSNVNEEADPVDFLYRKSNTV